MKHASEGGSGTSFHSDTWRRAGGNLAPRNVCQSAAGREEGVGTASESKVADLNGRIYGALL